jgi:hypothetical protein
MENLYVIGGQQRRLRSLQETDQAWHGYQAGRIVQVNTQMGESQLSVNYTSPPSVTAPLDPEILFQASAIQGDRLYTCTPTEVLIFALPSFERVGYISLPCFNDVHHVLPTPHGTLLVANAGLDMVLELTHAGDIRQVWNVLGDDPWGRFSQDVDYRRVASTKPHAAHPNYLYYVGDEVWVTRFKQSDTVCLTDPHKRIQLSHERIHDGVWRQGRIYFTTVNGTLVVANPTTLRVEEVIDLNRMHPEGTLLGWCRSLHFEGDTVWVGFSKIRATQSRENVAWLLRGFRRVKGTHLGHYDLARRRCLGEIDLEGAGLNAVFSILSVEPTLAASTQPHTLTESRLQPVAGLNEAR